MNEEFLSMREARQRRMEAIENIIQKYPIRTQDELVHKLLEEYGIETNQSAVSRDIQDLGLVKDRTTNCYTLNEQAKRNLELERLQTLILEGEAFPCDFPVEVTLLKTNPAYTHLIASLLEKLYSTEKKPIASFIGTSGSLLLVASKEQTAEIQEVLRTMVPTEKK